MFLFRSKSVDHGQDDAHDGDAVGRQEQQEELEHAIPESNNSSDTSSNNNSIASPKDTQNPIILPWKQALHQTCRKQQSLWATPQQVLQDVLPSATVLPRRDQVILVVRQQSHLQSHAANANGKENKEWIESIVQELSRMEPSMTNTASTSRSLTRRVLSGVSWTASKLYRLALGDDDDYENEFDVDSNHYDHNNHHSKWTQDGDNNLHGENPLVPVVDNAALVLCIDLLQDCLRVLQDTTLEYDQPFPLYRSGTGPRSFTGWCRQQQPERLDNQQEHCLLPYLSPAECHLLAQLLVALHFAVWDEAHDLIILLGESHQKKKAQSSAYLESTQVQVAIALFQLNEAIQESEQKIDQWTQMSLDCTQKARVHKTRGDTKAALWELQKRKLVQDKIESTRASLWNLHQTQLTLESTTQLVTQVMTAMQASSKALKQVREEMPDVDTVRDELQEEMDELQLMAQEFCTHNDIDDGIDDEALLLDLAQMTRDDENNAEHQESNQDQISCQEQQHTPNQATSEGPSTRPNISKTRKNHTAMTPAS